MEERRRTTRLGAWLHAVYTLPETPDKAAIALIRTASEGGVSLLTSQPLKAHAVVSIEVRSPGRRTIAFTAEVRWCKPLGLTGESKPPRAYEAGMQFRDISPDDRKAILLYTVLSPPSPMA
jgi:hypothetical protein